VPNDVDELLVDLAQQDLGVRLLLRVLGRERVEEALVVAGSQ